LARSFGLTFQIFRTLAKQASNAEEEETKARLPLVGPNWICLAIIERYISVTCIPYLVRSCRFWCRLQVGIHVGCLAKRFGKAFAKAQFGDNWKVAIVLGTTLADMGEGQWKVRYDGDQEPTESARSHLIQVNQDQYGGDDDATEPETGAPTAADGDSPGAPLLSLHSPSHAQYK